MKNRITYFFISILCCFISAVSAGDDFVEFEKEIFFNHTILKKIPNNIENENYLKLNKDGIKVYVYRHKDSDFWVFKSSTDINASLDSILAVMFDNNSGEMWIDACKKSFLIKKISFNERYHYHVFDIPFPFNDRDFIFHSTLKQNPLDKSVTIKMFSAYDYCYDKQIIQCDEVNQSKLVRVVKSFGAFKLAPNKNGTKITWIQDSDPAGNLPSWLVNQLVENTPYRTFKNLKKIVQNKKYNDAKLIYDANGMAIDLKY
ncbi:MAG: hypothetical protein GQ546_11170, partial [Gammaproteobacteria bacterium]|nr:hypothetical protein [Gammaproteobacteria bacterium]